MTMSLGLGLGISFGARGVYYASEAVALFARMTGQPTPTRKELISNLIESLKADGVWTKLDALYVMAAHDAQAAQRNWIADQFNLTEVSAPTFTADQGYQGSGTNYLGTGFDASVVAGAKFTLNSASFGFWSRTAAASATTGEFDMGVTATTVRADLRARQSTQQAGYIINENTLNTPANTDGSGFFAAIRSASNARTLRRNQTALASDTVASVSLVTGEFSILARGTSAGRSVRQIAAAFIGGALTPTESNALQSALNTYLTAVGAA